MSVPALNVPELNVPQNVLEDLLSGLIDYAGLYPPAGLDMGAAVHNYLAYANGANASALGRFIVDVARLNELQQAAGPSLDQLPLSLIVPANITPIALNEALRSGCNIEAIEIKIAAASDIERISSEVPGDIELYFEIPLAGIEDTVLDALASTGSRAKLRMGGIVAEAFPSADSIVQMLRALAARRIPFKATAGLHHPIRSRHPFTYAPGAPQGNMHGFVNLLCAAAHIDFGGAASEAIDILNEEDAGAFHITPSSTACRAFQWNAEHLRQVRHEFFISFGSCSFTEPLQDLETLGWL